MGNRFGRKQKQQLKQELMALRSHHMELEQKYEALSIDFAEESTWRRIPHKDDRRWHAAIGNLIGFISGIRGVLNTLKAERNLSGDAFVRLLKVPAAFIATRDGKYIVHTAFEAKTSPYPDLQVVYMDSWNMCPSRVQPFSRFDQADYQKILHKADHYPSYVI